MCRFVLVPLLVLAALTPRAAVAATQEQSCRKAVAKAVARLYQETLKGTQGCFKKRIATAGATTDCLDPAAFDPKGKVVAATSTLVATLGTGGVCGPLGPQFAPSCAEAPAACAAACASCGTGAEVAACLACRVVALTKGQVADVYGSPPDLAADAAARACQNALGAEGGKYGRARMKEQQKCQADVGANKLRADCGRVDRKGAIAKARGKAAPKIGKKCLPAAGDQVPKLDPAAACLAAATTADATTCALAGADATTDAIFRLMSEPASIAGFVMAIGPSGELVPLPSVRIEVVGAGLGMRTDTRGSYTLRGVPPGTQHVVIDGQRVGNHPRVAMGVAIGMVGRTNMGIFPMPAIDMANAVDVGAVTTVNPDGTRTLTAPVTLANPTIPGAELALAAGTIVTLDVPNRAPLLSVSLVPNNVMPFPSGVYADQLFTFQPEGTTIAPPAVATFPNYAGLPDGSSLDVYRPNFSTNGFDLAGTATVTGGGTLVTTDAPVVATFDWWGVAPPNPCLTDVTGRVVDVSTQPVAGATVLALGAVAVSAADGTFTIPGLSCPFQIVASAVVLNGGGALLVGQSLPTTVTQNGVTDVGDIVIDPPSCGNGLTFPPEECDDGNNLGGDGCSPTCTIEQCGNAIVDPGEECDATPGCTDFCTICGNGVLRTPGEECDLGAQNGVPGSGCSADCEISICGNGVREADEECDDGAANGGNFCDTACRIRLLGAVDLEFSAVRAIAECSSPTDSWGGLATCAPPLLESLYRFGPNGLGTFTASFANAGAEVALRASVRDVRDTLDLPVADAAGWQLRGTVRITLDGPSGSATLADTTVTGPAALDGIGALRATVPVAAATGVDFGAYTRHTVEVVELQLLDPTGAPFADKGCLVDPGAALMVDAPAAAAGGTLAITPAYVSCDNPGAGSNVSNGTVAGIPSCAPRELMTEQGLNPALRWSFGPDTVLAVRAQATANDLLITASGVGIRRADGGLADFMNGTVHLTIRVTTRFNATDMTAMDLPFAWPIQVVGGKFTLKSASVNAWLAIGGVPTTPKVATILRGSIRDPNGKVFATIGTSDGH